MILNRVSVDKQGFFFYIELLQILITSEIHNLYMYTEYFYFIIEQYYLSF